MRELSIEEKAQRFDEALRIAKDNFDVIFNADDEATFGKSGIVNTFYHMFPELKENEDELTWLKKFIKEEIDCLSIDIRDSKDRVKLENLKRSLALLEKQSEKIEPIEGFNTEFERQISHLIASTINKEYEYTEAFVKWTSNALLNYAKHEIEKKDEKKPLFNKGDIVILEGKEFTILNVTENFYDVGGYLIPIYKQNELKIKKFFKKVEPKFKVGDWIASNKGKDCSNSIMLIVDYNSDTHSYLCRERNGQMWNSGKFIESSYHLWTIRDAITGDVLQFDNKPFIYNGYLEEGIYPYAYGGINMYDKFCIPSGLLPMTHSDVFPATSEQREHLFSKMREAGYKWNARELKLEKVEN